MLKGTGRTATRLLVEPVPLRLRYTSNGRCPTASDEITNRQKEGTSYSFTGMVLTTSAAACANWLENAAAWIPPSPRVRNRICPSRADQPAVAHETNLTLKVSLF